MSDRDVVIRVENVSKLYRLGEVGTGSLAHDVNRWWHKVRGKEDPYLKIGEVNDRTKSAKAAGAKEPEDRPSEVADALHGPRRSKLGTAEGGGEGTAGGNQLADAGDSQSESSGSFEGPSSSSLGSGSAKTPPDRAPVVPASASSSVLIRDIRGKNSSAVSAPKAQAPSDWVYALKDVSFEVKRGEVLGIIGRNGAGKSTLLKILSRVTTQSSGQIKVRGRIASLLEVGTGFHPELTGRENIFLNGAILGMRKAEIARKFDEIVEFSGCARYIDTPVKRYSSGMYVRLAFAVAAHLEPEILIVDEVLAVGDAEFQKKCLGKMKDVAGHGRTILFVSHNMTSIAALCQKGIYMKNGTVDLAGSIDTIIKRYMEESSLSEDSSIEELRRAGKGLELAFTSIEMAGMQKNVYYGAPLIFDIKFNSKKDFKDLSMASSILNRSGSCVGTLFSPVRFDIKAGETKHIRLSIKNHKLAPDIYHAGFSIGHGGFDKPRRDLDVVIGRPHFEILPHSENHTFITWQSTNWGQIHFEDNEVEVVSSSL